MASFSVSGLDELYESISKATKVPDNVMTKVVLTMGEIIRAAQARLADVILRGPFTTGTTAKSVHLGKAKREGNGAKVSITFKGVRARFNTVTRNAAIAFINEFGKRGQKGRPFIKKANEENADEANEAGARVFFDWLSSIGL